MSSLILFDLKIYLYILYTKKMSDLTDPFLTHFRFIDECPDYDEILKIYRRCIHLQRSANTNENYTRLQDGYRQIYSLIGFYENKNIHGKRSRE